MQLPPFYDIHCHLLPGIDDGPADWELTLDMARMAVAEGAHTALCTPHQSARYPENTAPTLRRKVEELRQRLAQAAIPLEVGLGGDVRIEPDLVERLAAGQLATLADRQKHLLLELPHRIYWPLESLVAQLARRGVVGILTHPERNAELAARPALLDDVVAAGCLVQITADSVLGHFGRTAEQVCRRWLQRGQVHFVSSDAHDTQTRPPRWAEAFERVVEWTDIDTADALFSRNPRAVCEGRAVPPLEAVKKQRQRRWWFLVAQ